MKSAVRGAPLAMVGMVLAAWVGGRALLWQSPFPAAEALQTQAPEALFLRANRPGIAGVPGKPGASGAGAAKAGLPPALKAAGGRTLRAPNEAPARQRASGPTQDAARGVPGREAAVRVGAASNRSPPFLAPPAAPGGDKTGRRWSLDAWGFWREGSNAAPITQGRVPIYGASQIGAVLQYRLTPGGGRDVRLYARAYRAMVERGESELALGASLRPLRAVPVRALGELRLTDGAFRTETRPAAFAVTEIAPLALPLGTRLETYAQAGWVGGVDDTLFADGQASLTPEIPALASATGDKVRLSVGAGAWGGAQEGAHRVDLGPTVRLDLRIGDVPARLSLDWREKVEGDAGPQSGLAVTLASGF